MCVFASARLEKKTRSYAQVSKSTCAWWQICNEAEEAIKLQDLVAAAVGPDVADNQIGLLTIDELDLAEPSFSVS